MNSQEHTMQADTDEDAFGRRLAARLTETTDRLPHDIQERLRFARMQALQRRPRPQAASLPVVTTGPVAALGWGSADTSLWHRVGALLPMLLLVAGLVILDRFNNDHLARELAELDTALLTDDLPPAAYADPGFAQFLKLRRDQTL